MAHRRALPFAHRAVPFAIAVPVLLAATTALGLPGPGLAQTLEVAVPLATLPGPPPPLGLPLLQEQVSCPGLQKRLLSAVGPELPVWSITVADPQGRLLADLNGQRSRLPASNQKLITTAYALEIGRAHV